MKAFKTTLITSIGAFLIGVASPTPRLAFGTKVINSPIKPGNALMSSVDSPLAPVARPYGDPDAPAGYSPLGMAKIHTSRLAVYVYHNAPTLLLAPVQSHASAPVF